ncbi:peptidoglycan-binding protein [Rhizobium sp. NLR10a]|uniref:peptidoglycan-binding domain-containing protein n=1 Tax=unclassified Rhizobium TaxID=2613769 RepID=UPI001C82C596|nr:MULTISPECIES: peptidoglycan-binding domain-containing protein [unclassified Rhizobium]MBX5213966.1 peptidoglycan-binding protein [Rhizobium sp. NLR9a]MBX5218885.1 peptidoglycan-binding protein [Rhizobium sp. NLR8a]MBX5275355.1 peptidoglycan-binding protein [Rhizobium sp. NLR13a]MBX5281142.1 peptidoglycan-binding protein [Rhizobium sp. NLR10a]MBX5297538.1 peptidoglycan-binding protein [Rhizobium sp. NLR15a]
MRIHVKFSALAMACVFCAISTGRAHAEIRPVRDVQKALADQGFDAGTPDGIWGSKSVTALKGFQRAHQLAPSGVVTQDSLKALFPSSDADAQPAAAPADVVAAPVVPSVDRKPDVLSSEPVSLSSQVSLQAPATPVENRSGSRSGGSSGYLVAIFLILVAFLFFRRASRKSNMQSIRSKAGLKSGRPVDGRRAAR